MRVRKVPTYDSVWNAHKYMGLPQSIIRKMVRLGQLVIRPKQRKGAKANPKWNRTYLLKQYGMTEADFDAMLIYFNGRCGICRKLPGEKQCTKLAIDHDHVTGRVRGLLCGNCNMGLGRLGDNRECLLRALAYLA